VILTPSGDAYLHADNFENLYKNALSNATKMTRDNPLEQAAIDALDLAMGPKIKSVDGKWVRIGADDLKSFNGVYADAYKCMHDAVTGIGGNATELIEIGLRYNSNKFLSVVQTLPERDGNVGYVVATDSAKLKAFIESLKSAKIFKDINACAVNAGSAIDLSKIQVGPLPKTELWISRFNHQLKQVTVSTTVGKGSDAKKVTVDMTTDFNVQVNATAPKDFVPLTNLLPSVSSLLNATILHRLPTNLQQFWKQ
jgi:hypothetical protein